MRRLDKTVAGFLADVSGTGSRCGTAEEAASGGPVPLPEGFAALRPGPGLGAALARVPVRRVGGYDTVEVMSAAYRQVCHAQAVFLRALLETGMRRAHSGDTVSRVSSPGEFASEEARAALVWSRRRADSTFEFAWQVHERLPMLGAAMYAGVLDEPRARAFVGWTVGLSDDHAAQVITGLLPVAGGLLVGALIDRIKRAAIAVDPGWAERRYRLAVRGRRVEGSRNDDGTANLHGLDLPTDRAAAACERIDTLARACKHAGDGRPIGHIRADLYLGMLDGSYEHLTEDRIIDHVLTHPWAEPAAERDPDSSHNDDGDGRSDDAGDGGGGGGGYPGSDGGPGVTGVGLDGAGDSPMDDAGSGDSVEPGGDGPLRRSGAGSTGPGGSHVEVGKPVGGAGPAPARPGPGRWCVRELRVEIAAMLGQNEHPGEIPGWDVIPAALARPILASMHGAQWRWVVCDHDGRAIDAGITGRRPTTRTGPDPRRRHALPVAAARSWNCNSRPTSCRS